MEVIFTLILSAFVLLIFIANPRNKANRWCALAGIFFLLGIAKEAVLYNLIPTLNAPEELAVRFMPIYSACTWALYSLSTPCVLIFSTYFAEIDQAYPRTVRLVRLFAFFPALVFSFFFPPLSFRAFQLSSPPFWACYAGHNLIFSAAITVLMVRGVRHAKPGPHKEQKRRTMVLMLPPLLFWAASVFLTHPLQLTGYFKLWQWNAVIIAICVAMFIAMAFRNGAMGLKLSGEKYDWNSSMALINKGAGYTQHMLKNQTSKMKWCIDNLYAQCTEAGNPPPEELSILVRSIDTMEEFAERTKRHTDVAHLGISDCPIHALIQSGLPPTANVTIHIPTNIMLRCDKAHMTEVFTNIIQNGIDASPAGSAIHIESRKTRKWFELHFTDHGHGMTQEEIGSMFMPYYTTKPGGRNLGLGLAYARHIVQKHGGTISAQSAGAMDGTTVIIRLPIVRVHESKGPI